MGIEGDEIAEGLYNQFNPAHEMFADGFEAYQRGDFKFARTIFLRGAKLDVPCRTSAERCEQLARPPRQTGTASGGQAASN